MNEQQQERLALRRMQEFAFLMGASVGYMTSKVILESGGVPRTAMFINAIVFPMIMAGNFRPAVKNFFTGFALGSIYACCTINRAQRLGIDQDDDQIIYLRRK